MKKVSLILLLFSFIVFSCSDDNNDVPSWVWDTEEEQESGEDSEKTKPRFIWVDAAANFPDYANSKENISSDLKKVKDAGFTTVVVDVRPSMGDVLFKTTTIEQVKKLDVWSSNEYQYYERTATWDYLQAFIDAGHALDLEVYAAINTFTGGNKYPYGLGEQGLLFRDETKKHWATTLNLSDGLYNVMDINDDNYGTKFFNPLHEDVQHFLLSLLADLAKYNVDGIILDRGRYDDLTSDFSDYTKTKFEQYIGENIINFPNDILTPGATSLPETQPKYLKKWLEFRAKTIHDFIVKAQDKVKSVNNSVKFGVYVGAWYSTYYTVGVNWASPRYNTAQNYSKWATVGYKDFGYADHLDILLLGAYASANQIYGNTEWSVQGFCKQANTLLMDDVKFAGGPDVGNWNIPEGTDLSQAVINSVDAGINTSDGYFLFDIIHVKKYDYWDELKTGIDKYLKSVK